MYDDWIKIFRVCVPWMVSAFQITQMQAFFHYLDLITKTLNCFHIAFLQWKYPLEGPYCSHQILLFLSKLAAAIIIIIITVVTTQNHATKIHRRTLCLNHRTRPNHILHCRLSFAIIHIFYLTQNFYP